MSTSRPSTLLRIALFADAAASGATGLLMAFAAGPLADLLALPEALLRYAGLALLPFAALVAGLALRETLARPAVWAVIVCNALWAVDCVALAFGGWVEPSGLGLAFILMQALVVAGLAEAQYVGLRRSAAAA